MKTVVIPGQNLPAVTNWCIKHIAPQKFYIHTKMGGRGWQIQRTEAKNGFWKVTVEDDKLATIIALKFL